MIKLKQFNYTIRGFEFYGLCEIQSIETLPLIVNCTDLYLEGYKDGTSGKDDNPPDIKGMVDYQIILDIEDMVRLEHENA
jgi:hypothetical protein